MKHLANLASIAWIGVVITALAISNWSLYFVGRKYGLPVPLALVLSVPFDGAALVCANIALAYAREHGSHGNGVRGAVLVLAGLSAWLNSMHASLIHASLPAHVLYAVPPVVALYLFEAHIRYERRDALKAAGRLPDAQPILGTFVWSRHPWRSHKAMQAISEQRLSSRLAIDQAQLAARTQIERARYAAEVQLAIVPPELARATTQAEAVRIAIRVLGDSATAADIADWLEPRGWNVDKAYIRVARSRDASELRSLPASAHNNGDATAHQNVSAGAS